MARRAIVMAVVCLWSAEAFAQANVQAPAPAAPPTSNAVLQSVTPTSAAMAVAKPRETWGAIAFTADGSYSSAWKYGSKPEAEAHVLKGCAKYGRGSCEVVAFPGQRCAALAHYKGAHSGKVFRISHTGGGATSPEAQRSALDNCRAARNVRGNCQLRTVVCGDGR